MAVYKREGANYFGIRCRSIFLHEHIADEVADGFGSIYISFLGYN